MSSPWLLHIVADYAPGDLAFSELVTALAGEMQGIDWRMHTTTVPNFDTLATGFVVAQLGLAKIRPERMMIFANCAPRRDMSQARIGNAGEKLVYAKLQTGVPVLIVDSGYSLSFIRESLSGEPEEADLWGVRVENKGSQFRSRDRFPASVGKLARGEMDLLGARIDSLSIPQIPRGVTAYIDNFRNIKTTWRVGDRELETLEAGMPLLIRINGIIREAVFSDGSFNVSEGQMAFAPGSSGYDRRFFEVFQRGGHAADLFGGIQSGMKVEFAPLGARF